MQSENYLVHLQSCHRSFLESEIPCRNSAKSIKRPADISETADTQMTISDSTIKTPVKNSLKTQILYYQSNEAYYEPAYTESWENYYQESFSAQETLGAWNVSKSDTFYSENTPKPKYFTVGDNLSLAESLMRDLRSLAIESQNDDLKLYEESRSVAESIDSGIRSLADSMDSGSISLAESLVTQSSRGHVNGTEPSSDARRLEQRQKQIDYGKNTIGYQRYIQFIEKSKRKRSDPVTPDIYCKCSKRSWDGLVRKWRRKLHLWDPLDENSNPNLNDQEKVDDFASNFVDIESQTTTNHNIN